MSADDLWLKFNESRLGIKVCKISPKSKEPVVVRSSQTEALTKTNNGKIKHNDIVIKQLQELFNISWSKLFAEEIYNK